MRIIGNAGTAPRKVRAVASGALASGDTVVVNSNGTVSAAVGSGSPAAVGSDSVFETGPIEWAGGTYDSNSNKVVFVYKDGGNSDYATAIVGTVSGTSISFGTPVVYASINTDSSTATFDSNSNKVVVSYYKNNVDDSYSIVGTVSGTNISFGSEGRWSTTPGVANIGTTFDSSNNKVIIAFYDPANSYYGTVIIGTVSGTNISFGSGVVFQTARIAYPSCTFDTNSNKVIISYYLNSNSVQYAIVGTVSGTSISFGSPSATGITSVEGSIATVYDSNSNKTVIASKSASSYGRAVVGTVSGTSISFGTPVAFTSAAIEGERKGPHGAFNSDLNQVVIFLDGDGYGGTVYTGTVNGTSISFDSGLAVSTGAHDINEIAGCFYDDAAEKIVVGYGDQSNGNKGTANVVTPNTFSTNITAENYIGIASNGYATGQAAEIDVKGSIAAINNAVTNFAITVVNPGSGNKYYIDGTLQATISLSENKTYRFDQSASSNSGHPLRFSTTSDGTHGGGAEYITGVTTVGTPGSSGAYTQITVAVGAPTLYFYCSVHSGMGGTANTPDDFSLTAGQSYFVQTNGDLGLTAGTPSVFAGTAVSATKLIVKG